MLYTIRMPVSSYPVGTLLAVDPGLRACGVALFKDGVLARAGAIRGPRAGRGPDVWSHYADLVAGWVAPHTYPRTSDCLVLVETMKVYVKGRSDPADLIELGGVAGSVVGALARAGWRADGVKAAEWNGQVPSEVRRERTQAWVKLHGWGDRVDLDTTQRYQEDVWSALGIGRWHVGGRRRV